jgi:hypothetical protein
VETKSRAVAVIAVAVYFQVVVDTHLLHLHHLQYSLVPVPSP